MSDDSEHADKRLRFEQDLTECLPQMHRYVYSRTKDKYLTETIVQDSVVNVWLRQESSNWELDIESLIAFLIRTAHNLSVDHFNTQKGEQSQSLDENDGAQTGTFRQDHDLKTDIEARIYCAELLRMLPLQVIFLGLDDYEKRIFFMDTAEEMTLAEIAEEEGVNIDSLRYHLIKVKGKVRYRAKCYMKETHRTSLFKRDA